MKPTSSPDDETSLHLDAELGAAEQRTEPYKQYGEEAAQAGTPLGTKSARGAASNAGRQPGTLQGVSEHTGFPNPATDTNIISLDLNSLLIKHPASTFFMRVNDDIVVVDRALEPKPHHVVVFWDEEEYALSRFRKLPRDVKPWGVVTAHIRRYQP